MPAIYDNWERLVAAVIKKQQLWDLFHQQSRSPSSLSDASDFTSSRSHQSPPQLVLLSDFSPPLDAADGVSASLLGRGASGSAYVAEVGGGRRFVVKRVKMGDIWEDDFRRKMEIVGGVKHENVVALRAYYSSAPESDKLLLYDYYANGSVYSLLYGEHRADVGWETRVRIAIGAARGIAAIHTQLGGILAHGSIKPSNILLNQQLYGCVSDLGLAKATFTPSSQPSDVYGFGVLLLQLLTRKPTAQAPLDLIKLVYSIKSKERAANVFDPHLLKRFDISQQMIKMLQIGLRCVAKSSRRRPKISEVVEMLKEIMIPNPLSRCLDTAGLEGELVFLEDSDHMVGIEVEQLKRAPSEVLGSGPFGTCLKARLKNGSMVVVKMLRHVTATFKEFQQHVEVYGRMRHENVGRLKAYYYSRNEKLLVYDYYDHGSLSTLLNLGKCLEWGSRVEIAVGAARGIAYIHGQEGGKLVVGNIKSSNILVEGENHGIIGFDAGLGRLISAVELSRMLLSSGCCAPELEKSGELSQAGDVYSFGVVLLDLFSGRPCQETKCGEGLEKVEDVRMQVLQIAMGCVCRVAEDRPTMLQVVGVLEGIRISSGGGGGGGGESRIGCFLEDLLPLLLSA